ncbi:MFS transporter (Mch2) [Aspergillus bombycis]|uniref:MFS transporter (Mch2) n=1 Tax=Aspergillus bombycis TaxID=109264 RepID=A0A1F7ZSU5_9EURO|nr:MFS transporter (Mch2) [Aspergillus bombycis]OGM42551.1 MFS transporter (Mch2) [Aspergillus bombycis]
MEKDIQRRNDQSQPLEGPVQPPTLQQNEPSTPPDGGYGWVCTAAAATINAHSWGFNSAYGVFLAHYLKHDTFPGSPPLKYAFVGSLSVALLLLVSPIATIGVREWGIKPTMFCGVILETASLICASFATEIWQLFLTQGILFGMGVGFLFIPTAAVVPQWFTTKRSLASGISLSGAGLGGLIYSLATNAMIRNLGLQWAFRILGILGFIVNTTCTLLIKDRNSSSSTTTTSPHKQTSMNLTLLRKAEYQLLLGFASFTMLGYFVLMYSLANYANKIGLNASQASIITAIFNLGQAVGRPCIGYFSDRVGRINMAGSMTFLAGILALVVWTNAKSYGVLGFFAVAEGLVGGNFWATIAPLMAEVVGLKEVAAGLNLLWLSIVLPCTFKMAFDQAMEGRPEPVLVAIPIDVSSATFDSVAFENASKELSESAKIPVATTLLGLGSFDETKAQALHMVGTHGAVSANYAVQNADLILALGARLDERVVSDPESLAPKAIKGRAEQSRWDCPV